MFLQARVQGSLASWPQHQPETRGHTSALPPVLRYFMSPPYREGALQFTLLTEYIAKTLALIWDTEES